MGIKVGDTVKGPLGHEGPVTEIKGDRVTFQITKEEVRLDFTDYDVDGDPIVYSHFMMECNIKEVEKI